MRLIDADALLDFLQIIPIDLGYREIEDVENFVKELPTIDAVPVRHGRWVKKGQWYCCTECGTEMFFTGVYDPNQHYCYYCGVKMDGGDPE